MTNRYFEHQELIKRNHLLVTKEIPELRLFNRISGLLFAKRVVNNIISYIPLKSSITGMGDQYGYYRLQLINFPISLGVELEFKTGKAKYSKDQENWKGFCDGHGVIHFQVRDEIEFIKNFKERIEIIKKELIEWK